MGRLTTHILDTANGCPGAGIKVELFRPGAAAQLISTATSNVDGRCDGPLLEGEEFVAGEYELVFHVGDYFDKLDQHKNESARTSQEDGQSHQNHRFLNQVVIRFGVNSADEHYHVPLLLSPFGYSTYRGS